MLQRKLYAHDVTKSSYTHFYRYEVSPYRLQQLLPHEISVSTKIAALFHQSSIPKGSFTVDGEPPFYNTIFMWSCCSRYLYAFRIYGNYFCMSYIFAAFPHPHSVSFSLSVGLCHSLVHKSVYFISLQFLVKTIVLFYNKKIWYKMFLHLYRNGNESEWEAFTMPQLRQYLYCHHSVNVSVYCGRW